VPSRLPTLACAVLAQLAREPMTGYELAQRMRGAMAYFWAAPHSQIYPQLAALADEGLVVADRSEGPGPRDKKTYRTTPAGAAALAAWVAEPVAQQPVRDELTLKAYAASAGDPSALAAMFATEAERHRDRLAEYRRHEAELRATFGALLDDPARPEFGNWSALALGLRSEQAKIEWCEWMVTRLQVSAAATGSTSPAGQRNRGPHSTGAPSRSG